MFMNSMKVACRSFVLLAAVALSSCVSHQELINFDQANLEAQSPEEIANATNLVVQPEDLLKISVHTLIPEAALPFNLDGGAATQNLGNQGAEQLELFTGYFVDQLGFIDYPGLGRVPVAGKTLEEVKLDLLARLSQYVSDPVVNIRFLNFKVTVLGEVNIPGTLRLTNKRVTLLEALGRAGDLSIYANRTNVLVMRERGGERTYQRINLQTDEVFESEYYYLQQNDVIYVEPLQSRVATVADPATRIISYGTAALSLVSLIIVLTSR